MKTRITYLFGWLFVTTVTISSAQESQSLAYASDVPKNVKNSEANSGIISNSGTARVVNVEEKVSKAFESTFAAAEKVRWYEKSKKDLVKFVMDGQEHIALFNKNGSLYYHVSYGYEKNLPEAVKNLVNVQYSSYTITKVMNINQKGRNFWVLNIENPQYFKILNVEGGKITEMDDFKTAAVAL